MDSHHQEDDIGVTGRIQSWLYAEVLPKYGRKNSDGLQISKLRFFENEYKFVSRASFPSAQKPRNAEMGDYIRIPHQEDLNSCGAFMMKNMECVAGGKPLFYLQRNAELLQKRMALDLYSGFIRL